MQAKFSVPLLVLAIGGLTIAQQTTSSSTSQSTGGSASASSSASSRAQAGGGQGASARAGGSQTGSGAASSNGERMKVTRPTHVIVYSPNPVAQGNSSSTVSQSVWEDQKKYYEMLGMQGKLLYAGPWRDMPGALLIVCCQNDQEAQNIADEDPAVKSTLFVGNVKAWNVTYIGPFVVQPDRSGGTSGASTGRGGGAVNSSGSQSGGGSTRSGGG